MKKKFLIALFVVVMACLFAFTVNAANEVTLTDGTTADLTTVFKMDKTGTQVTGFDDGYTKDDVTDVIFPDEIEGIEANILFNSAANLNTITFAATDTFFISGDAIFSKCSVKTITFNPDCVVELRKGNFSDCKNLTQITFPKFKKLAGSAFAGCSSMVATNELVFAEGMTEIGGHVFNGCTSLTGTVYFPASLEKIQEYSFQNTGFTHFDLSKCVNLTAVGGGYGGPFTDNDKITSLDLSACVNLKDLKGSFASGCDELVEVILPPNLENIPVKAFAHCYKMQSIVFPASLKTVADEAFHSARRDQEIKTFTVYIQSNVKMGESYPFRDSSAKIEYVLIGDGVTAESFIKANTFSGVTGATIVDYLDPASPWTYVVGETITGHTIVENYCKSLALTKNHLSDENPCVILCSTCGLSAVKENPEHTLSVTITYENGYDSTGAKVVACTNPGCPHAQSEEVEALLVCRGYSAAEFGAVGVTIGFKVNVEVVAEYEAISGKDVSYGAFAGSQVKLGQDDIFGENGKPSAGVVAVEISNSFEVIEVKVVGFADDQKDLKFAMGAYVAVTDGEGTEYFYLQEGVKNAGEKYFFSSFNDIVSSIK